EYRGRLDWFRDAYRSDRSDGYTRPLSFRITRMTQHMSERAQNQSKQSRPASFAPVSSGVLRRKCAACGNHAMPGGECGECRNKGGILRRNVSGQAEVAEAPPIVEEPLRSPGPPLDTTTRAFMEPRFGHDFSGVRVHPDARAAESPRAVNALAYTVGSDIVFASGLYRPSTGGGRRVRAPGVGRRGQRAPWR